MYSGSVMLCRIVPGRNAAAIFELTEQKHFPSLSETSFRNLMPVKRNAIEKDRKETIMNNTELMSYNESFTNLTEDKEYSSAALFTIIAGLLGAMAAGTGMTAEAADLLPMLSALAVPGLFAAVVAYLLAKEGEQEEVMEVTALG